MALQGKVAMSPVRLRASGVPCGRVSRGWADIAVADLRSARSQEKRWRRIQKWGASRTQREGQCGGLNDAKAMADQVMPEWGRIDILVNNAGITVTACAQNEEKRWNLVLQVNLNGTFHCTKAVLLPMTKHVWTDCNIASIVGAMG